MSPLDELSCFADSKSTIFSANCAQILTEVKAIVCRSECASCEPASCQTAPNVYDSFSRPAGVSQEMSAIYRSDQRTMDLPHSFNSFPSRQGEERSCIFVWNNAHDGTQASRVSHVINYRHISASQVSIHRRALRQSYVFAWQAPAAAVPESKPNSTPNAKASSSGPLLQICSAFAQIQRPLSFSCEPQAIHARMKASLIHSRLSVLVSPDLHWLLLQRRFQPPATATFIYHCLLPSPWKSCEALKPQAVRPSAKTWIESARVLKDRLQPLPSRRHGRSGRTPTSREGEEGRWDCQPLFHSGESVITDCAFYWYINFITALINFSRHNFRSMPLLFIPWCLGQQPWP